METVAFCEIDPFCRKVLKKHWGDVPIFKDIRTLDGRWFEGAVDIVCGGFPCQPFSVAGKRKGKEDDRDLWGEMFRIIKEAKPTWVIGENVANFVNMEFERTVLDLEGEGYEVQAFIIPACAVNAPHRRDRVWIIAYNDSIGLEKTQTKQQAKRCERGSASSDTESIGCYRRRENENNDLQERAVCEEKQEDGDGIRSETSPRPELCGVTAPDSRSERVQGKRKEPLSRERAFSWCEDIRGIEDYFNRPDIPQPLICREDDGFSGRMDRLRSLGNAVVPQIPEIIGRYIMEIENE